MGFIQPLPGDSDILLFQRYLCAGNALFLFQAVFHVGSAVGAMPVSYTHLFRIFLQIVLPLSKALIGVLTLYYAVGHWNEYFLSLIHIWKKRLRLKKLIFPM